MIVFLNQIPKVVKKLKEEKKKIVLVGGCFDVIHPGHVVFLEKAKQEGNTLIVLLESDEAVRKIKGIKRPYHNQNNRAQVLSSLKSVDCVVMLPLFKNDLAYEELIKKIKPDIIAVTAKYGKVGHHQRIAKQVGAKLKFVTRKIANHSSSRILSYRG